MKLIGITGKKRSGKSTTAQYIQEQLGDKAVILSFADALKDEVLIAINAVNRLAGLPDIDRTFLEKNKANFRLILQGWGTDYRRNLHGDQYWIKKLEEEIEKLRFVGCTTVIVPDVRFMNEAEFIESKGGNIIRVVNGHWFANDSHQSETELESIRTDYTIFNEGSLDLLKNRVIQFLLMLELIKAPETT